MDEKEIKEVLIDYLEGNLTGELRAEVAERIGESKSWKKEFENLKEVLELMENSEELIPSATLKSDFDKMLLQEMADAGTAIDENTETTFIYWNSRKMWMQIAASVALLVVGVLVGSKWSSDGEQKEILALQQEMMATKNLVLASLQNQSASSRINAVNVSYEISTMDDDIVDALIHTMNADRNANVRLAAVDALSQFANEHKVREALITSLSIQDNPAVQIALINLMVMLKESRAVEPLQKIINDDKSIEAVKDEANYSVFKLS